MPAEDTLWENLLPAIARGEVLPVIGPDLLWIEHEGREEPLYEVIAAKLAKSLGLGAKAATDIEQLTVAYLKDSHGNQPEEIYQKLEIEIGRLRDAERKLPRPRLLQQLARLPFDLWLTTTPDTLLQETLGIPEANAARYSPPDPRDLASRVASKNSLSIFHMFGRFKDGPGRAALLEIDILEFLWCLHADLRDKLPNLKTRLDSSRLLLLGTSHPDWLARFFIRLTRPQPLSSTSGPLRGTREFIVDRVASADKKFGRFISVFNAQGGIFQAHDARLFVPELLRRWDEYAATHDLPTGHQPARAGAAHPAASADGRTAVFISYASADRQSAIALAAKLTERGLNYWLDVERQDDDLVAKEWWPEIERRIRGCDIFVALISSTTLRRDEGVFMREWNTAVDFKRDVNNRIRSFLWALVVDEVASSAVAYPGVEHHNINRAPRGVPSETLLDSMQKEVRARRSRSQP